MYTATQRIFSINGYEIILQTKREQFHSVHSQTNFPDSTIPRPTQLCLHLHAHCILRARLGSSPSDLQPAADASTVPRRGQTIRWGLFPPRTLSLQHEGQFLPPLRLTRENLADPDAQLNSLDNMRVSGRFMVGKDIPEGQGSVISLLEECFEIIYELRIEAEPDTETETEPESEVEQEPRPVPVTEQEA